MSTTPTTPPAPPTSTVPRVRRPGAPPRVQLGVGAVALVAAFVVPEPPGAGLLVLAAAVAAVVLLVRSPGVPGVPGVPGAPGAPGAPVRPRRSRWQAVHGGAAVLLAGSAAVRDAGWVVALCLAGAVLLGTLALAPAGSWSAVLAAPLRPVGRLATGAGWLVRGVEVALGRAVERLLGARGQTGSTARRRWRRIGPAVRGTALAAVLLAVFVPLLASADARFGSLFTGAGAWVDAVVVQLGAWLGLTRVDVVVGRVVVFALAAVATAAALAVAWEPRRAVGPGAPSGRSGPTGRVLDRRVEWLLPLGALDALFGAFLVVRVTAPADGGTFAEQLHAGFAQLVVATALVLGVVALAVRWTPMTAGPRAALGLLCLLSLGIDAAAVSDLVAYVEAYGLTRLRVAVGVVCAGLAGLLVLLLAAGAVRGRREGAPRQGWVPQVAVLVAAASLLGLVAADPDALVARSQLARLDGPSGPDLPYLWSLSADAVPAVASVLRERPGALGPDAACLLALSHTPGSAGWASANLARWRAERALADLPGC